jgi:hypothetical protein
MKIDNFNKKKKNARVRVSATVTWEDCARPEQEIFFETTEAFAEDLTCNPHAFLIACVSPALRHGEKRIILNEPVCAKLHTGLVTIMNLLRHWYGPKNQPITQIEANFQAQSLGATNSRRAGTFFSSGVDSLANLRLNRLNFSLDHPAAFKDALVVYGMNIESDNRIETFDQRLNQMAQVAADARINLIPVYTNMRYLDDDAQFFERQFHSAILAASAHAFAKRLADVSISSSFEYHNLFPWGSHPLLDPNYSSHDLRITHDGIALSRLDKIKVIADWDVGLQNISVCYSNWPGKNCCRCDKCGRTMLSLLALGVLERCGAFDVKDVTEKWVLSALCVKPYHIPQMLELKHALAQIGRDDLVGAIEKKLSWFQQPDWQKNLKQKMRPMVRFDEKYLGGSIKKLKTSIHL